MFFLSWKQNRNVSKNQLLMRDNLSLVFLSNQKLEDGLFIKKGFRLSVPWLKSILITVKLIG